MVLLGMSGYTISTLIVAPIEPSAEAQPQAAATARELAVRQPPLDVPAEMVVDGDALDRMEPPKTEGFFQLP